MYKTYGPVHPDLGPDILLSFRTHEGSFQLEVRAKLAIRVISQEVTSSYCTADQKPGDSPSHELYKEVIFKSLLQVVAIKGHYAA